MNRRVGVVLSFVSMFFEILSTLSLTPFIIRTLGPAEFGVYKLSAAITAYLLLLDLGVGNAIIRYISKYIAQNDRGKERRFFGIATIFYAIVGLAAFISGCVIARVFPVFFSVGLTADEARLGQKLLFLTAINCAVTLATACYNNIILAYERFALSRMCSIVSILVKLAATYIVLKMGYGSVGIVAVHLCITVLTKLFLIWYVFVKLKLFPLFKNIDSGFVKEIVAYSLLVCIQMVATQLNSGVDQILIGRLVSSSAVIIGIYGIGAQIVQYYQSIGVAFTGVLMPGVVQMVEKNASVKVITDEMIRIGRIILTVLALIWSVFLINGRNFIVLWAGKDNEAAYCVAVWLMFAYMFILAESIGTQVLWAMNKHKEQAYLKLAIVLLNIFLTVVLIRWKPLIGATIGTFISLIIGDIVVMNVIFKVKLNMPLHYYYRGLLKGILPCTLISLLSGLLIAKLLPATWLGFVAKVCVMVLVYGAAMLLFGMNRYEKRLLGSLLGIQGND